MPGLRRIAFAAVIALSVGLSAIAIGQGLSPSFPIRLLESAAIGVVAIVVIGAIISMVMGRLADWRDPRTEAEFEEVVRRSERLARDGVAAEPEEIDFLQLDPLDDEDFEELVRDALDDLPDLLRNALEHVAVVISDDGRKTRAYGLYHGDGAHRDDHPDRIVIYRDTLRRDFGHDPDLLREQVVRTVRHELAHHVGFDEMGVQGLGL
ncbi:MAG TPA: metallopeptidase family protein [Capillimicrobium sp.]|nr:metallopeptidase family protein [Capillimicrobium sp.]